MRSRGQRRRRGGGDAQNKAPVTVPMPVYQTETQKVDRSKPMMISRAEAEHNLEKAQESLLEPIIESIKTIKESKKSLMKV
ncbi:hypothetical protein VTP01DRAFT_5020 [Rhizomucor pusillus]|uniref:uncharacterized protein n=1 Tax=Rhizomucor pusillus TaxID=4840 RepID=UPI003742981C